MAALTEDEAARAWERVRFHQQHEDFMRASGFPDWRWPDPPVYCHEDDFERWLIERWLAEVRSDRFKQSAEYHYLRAEWEREG